jgi:Domain of unknown function (DUF4301)
VNAERLEQFNSLLKLHQEIEVESPCEINNGIVLFDEASEAEHINYFKSCLNEVRVEKFVPASGAATRMFASVNNADINNLSAEAEEFLLNINSFPFYPLIQDQLNNSVGGNSADRGYFSWAKITELLFDENKLNFLKIPKGLVPFHSYNQEIRNAFEEHLFSFSEFTQNQNQATIHYTVQEEFKQSIQSTLVHFSSNKKIHTLFEYSTQNPVTDVPALDEEGCLLLNEKGEVFTRPAGHGALLVNLNNLNGECVFIQNIDNIPHASLENKIHKKRELIGGLLLHLVRERNRLYRGILNKDFSHNNEAINFLNTWFHRRVANDSGLLLEALNRPIRICGMVKNSGDPGGGPFWVRSNGAYSKQIIESSQIQKNNKNQNHIFNQSTHFNPVDMACNFIDPEGKKYNLENFTNSSATLVSDKIIFGKKSKILELPGLWNGAMWHWNTVFVDLPSYCFHPVKTVNDLLKEGHNPI